MGQLLGLLHAEADGDRATTLDPDVANRRDWLHVLHTWAACIELRHSASSCSWAASAKAGRRGSFGIDIGAALEGRLLCSHLN